MAGQIPLDPPTMILNDSNQTSQNRFINTN